MQLTLFLARLPGFSLIIGFGLVGALGQTFLTGLFLPDFQAQFGISLAGIGAGYGAVVALASLALPLVAPPLWRLTGGVAGFAAVVLCGAALSAAALTVQDTRAEALFAALFGLRLAARHGAAFLMELVTVQARPELRESNAALTALLYPATLICLPPVIDIARQDHGAVWFWGNVALVCAVAGAAAALLAAFRCRRGLKAGRASTLPARHPLPERSAWRLLRNPDFVVLTWAYLIPLVVDTVLILFLSTYADDGLPLATYAAGQIAGVLGLQALRRQGLGLRAALFGHLWPLLLFFPAAAMPSDLTPHLLLGALGLSIGASNVLGLLCYSERLDQNQLPLALSLRALIAMAVSALAAGVAGWLLETQWGWVALLASLGIALPLAWALIAWVYPRARRPKRSSTLRRFQ